jgi:hypothetical protein
MDIALDMELKSLVGQELIMEVGTVRTRGDLEQIVHLKQRRDRLVTIGGETVEGFEERNIGLPSFCSGVGYDDFQPFIPYVFSVTDVRESDDGYIIKGDALQRGARIEDVELYLDADSQILSDWMVHPNSRFMYKSLF